MLRKSTKDHSAKLNAVSAVLDQLTPDILKTNDGEAVRKCHAVEAETARGYGCPPPQRCYEADEGRLTRIALSFV
jgi:hypothetical protein